MSQEMAAQAGEGKAARAEPPECRILFSGMFLNTGSSSHAWSAAIRNQLLPCALSVKMKTHSLSFT